MPLRVLCVVGCASCYTLNATKGTYFNGAKHAVHNGRGIRHCLNPISVSQTDGNSPRYAAAKKKPVYCLKETPLARRKRSPLPLRPRPAPSPPPLIASVSASPFTAGSAARRRAAFTSTPKAKHNPLVVIPGGPGLPHDYLETLEGASKDDRVVVLFDPIGTGNSTALPANVRSTAPDLLGTRCLVAQVTDSRGSARSGPAG